MPSKSSSSLTLLVKPRGKPIRSLPSDVSLSASAKTSSIYEQVANQSHFSIHRLRITKGSDGSLIPNSKTVSIESTGLRDQSTISVKDLGPQIAWRTVFLIEYAGPILLHPLFYFLAPYIYTNPNPLLPFPSPSALQTLFLAMIIAHFVKRELETMFVHRFSLATMPAFNIFKNSAHYWLLAGLNTAYWTYAPTSPAARTPTNPAIAYAAIAFFLIGELGNLSTHLTLRDLRRPGTTERNIPTSGLFSVVPVTCPNYFFEIVAWIGMWLASWSASTGLFVIVAGGQMYVWAKKKERKYRSEFGDKYKRKRSVMIPGIL